VVVDVLSFTTTVSVGIDHGLDVYPYRWRDESAYSFAAERNAVVAGNRGEGISLSPASLSRLDRGDRIVLPSPNGATICISLIGAGVRVIAGALRNAHAVSSFVAANGWSVAVIAAGETARGDSRIRPCFEDLIGAGAILAGLDPASHSPEAETCVAAFEKARDRLPAVLSECVGGRELTAWGYPQDVSSAAAYRSSDCVPMLHDDGYFFNAGRGAAG
jgi:2-phosphosulfolactate phosphatase